jgi:hypothetical protein
MPNLNENQFMMTGGMKHVAGTLVNSKYNVQARMAAEVQQNPNNRHIIEGA